MTTRRWRRPSGFALALTVVGIAAFIRLGIWQLDRAVQKEQLLASFAEAPRRAPQPLDAVRDIANPRRYPHVRVHGHFLADRGYLLDEQAFHNRLGVHAIGVFAGDGEQRLLLVDRGWVVWDHAPGSSPVLPALPSGEVALTGIYAPFPGGGLRIGGDALRSQTAWPKLTLYLDHAAIAADLHGTVLPRMLLLDPAPASGFVRAWKPDVMPPQRHRAYAVQWFGFAIVALLIFLGRHWRRADGTNDEREE